jgi:hypothetical protein
MRGSNDPEALASRKVVWSNPCTEVSGTANTCTDEQELHMRTIWMSKPIITTSKIIVDGYVDAAGIGRRLFILPGEVFLFF